MKSISTLFISACVLLLAGCASNPEPRLPLQPLAQKTTYIGTLPCADCSGIKNTLVLYRDQYDQPTRYQLTQDYIDADNNLTVIDRGEWSIKPATNLRKEIFVLSPDLPQSRKLFLHKAANAVEQLSQDGSLSQSGLNYTLIETM